METFEVPQDATSHYLKMLTFRQYMRGQNEDDEKLIREFAPKIPVPDGWDIEDHFEDLRPGVWMKNNKYVIMVYGSLGMIAACFGEVRDPHALPENDFSPYDTKHDQDKPKDFSMVFPIFPPEDIPYHEEKDGDEKENFDVATQKLEDFMTGCIEYMSSASRDGSALDKKKAKEAKNDLDVDSNGPSKNPSGNDDSTEKTPSPVEKRL